MKTLRRKDRTKAGRPKVKEVSTPPLRISKVSTLAEMRVKYFEWAVRRYGGNKVEAARAMGISVRTLYNYGIE